MNVASLSAFVGAPVPLVEERLAALRGQYERDLAFLPASARPRPPAAWCREVGEHIKGARVDPATMYAWYRVQADERVFASADRPPPVYVSVDLETAAPDGNRGFVPRNGHIIEVGIVVVDDRGAEIDRYEQLIRPPDAFLAEHGTGRADIHHITTADLSGAPDWTSCAPRVGAFLESGILLAQGAHFEHAWLGHHLPAAGLPWDSRRPTVDTLSIARMHYPDLDKHRLAFICDAVGVPYTTGHRALHDAVAAARAFFAMRAQIRARCAADPLFASLPLPH